MGCSPRAKMWTCISNTCGRITTGLDCEFRDRQSHDAMRLIGDSDYIQREHRMAFERIAVATFLVVSAIPRIAVADGDAGDVQRCRHAERRQVCIAAYPTCDAQRRGHCFARTS